MHGLWTSFLNAATWGTEPLPLAARERLVQEMLRHDDAGLDAWVGEDFDPRVLSMLEEHAKSITAGDEGQSSANMVRHTIIVEQGRQVRANLLALRDSLGSTSLRWVQLGPPALPQLEIYRALKAEGVVEMFGVEDYTPAQVDLAHAAIGVVSVQQEISLLSRPSPEMYATCERIGCAFVGYGPLLGGLLSDKYLGQPRPSPSPDHRPYFYTIDGWGDWTAFQRLLSVLRRVGDRHGPASVSSVALAYTLALPRVAAVILGVRLGVGADHRGDSIAALEMQLSASDIDDIDAVVFHSAGVCVSDAGEYNPCGRLSPRELSMSATCVDQHPT